MRVLRSARKMGIKTVAVYSEADRHMPHVRFADEAVCLGLAASKDSYLRGDKIVEIAKELGVDGIHPGYGFLSENAGFSQLAEDNGITFIGPKPKAIEMMGSKLAAKDAVKKFNVPMVPGVDHAISDFEEAKKVAQEVGYPVLIKASAGGGGKGMRVVEEESELKEQMERAISEATSSFGDGSVFIEKFVTSPRHIEIQVLADAHGNVLYLFERECSIQRRHQKVVEEAPSAILTPEIRKAMGEAAVMVAKSCDYLGAGTVEFLMDDKLNFYFLEMNTRLQVEHPVTEFITGLDLVEQQIRIARGETLSIKQEDLSINGHSIELRVTAEDPLDNFLPNVGKLDRYRPPVGEHIRVDDGYEEGLDVPIYYDPLLAKLIVWGVNRDAAIRRMLEAISMYEVKGVKTTLPFGRFVMEHDAFISGQFDTNFVKQYFTPDLIKQKEEEEAGIAAQVALKLHLQEQQMLQVPDVPPSPWWKVLR